MLRVKEDAYEERCPSTSRLSETRASGPFPLCSGFGNDNFGMGALSSPTVWNISGTFEVVQYPSRRCLAGIKVLNEPLISEHSKSARKFDFWNSCIKSANDTGSQAKAEFRFLNRTMQQTSAAVNKMYKMSRAQPTPCTLVHRHRDGPSFVMN